MLTHFQSLLNDLKEPPKANYQSGQIAVIVLLIMVVILGVAVQLAQQTAEDAQVSIENTETTRVFYAAESAAEEALAQLESNQSIDQINQYFENSNTFDDQFQDPSNPNATQVRANVNAKTEFESFVPVGISITINPNTTASDLDIYWARQGITGASLLVTLFRDDGSKITSQYYAYGSSSTARNDGIPQVSAVTSTQNGNVYTSFARLSYPADVKLIRIMPLYASTHLYVANLTATQAHVIRGTASDTNSQQSRTIELVRGIKAAPSIMDYALFSGGSLEK